MFDYIFLSLLNMSMIASFVIVAVLLMRVLLKKAPKIFSYALWAVVLFRLLCPFTFESVIGLLPADIEPISQDIVYQEIPEINTGITIVDDMINPILPPVTNPGTSVNPIQIWIFMGRIIWGIGIAIMLAFSVVQFVQLKRKLCSATPLKDNIYIADLISTPFVMGLLRPKIYLPSTLLDGEKEFIIAHEQYHIKRLDHITRILAFIALSLHWFNPLVWIAFILSGKDMEMSCDEAVMGKIDSDIRTEYSVSLLRLATGKRFILATPLAFGEGNTKTRVKNILKYKKPVARVSIAFVAIIALLLIVCGTNRISIFKPETMKYAQNFSLSGIDKIEVVSFLSGQEQYQLIDEDQYLEIVEIIHESSGREVEQSKATEQYGGTIYFYITKSDGNILTLGNIGNTYLQIGNDYFKADYDFLNSFWDYEGNQLVPDDFHYGEYETPDSISRITVEAGEAVYQLYCYESGFDFDYDELQVITIDDIEMQLLINYPEEFSDMAYWGIDVYFGNVIERVNTFETYIEENNVNYLYICDDTNETSLSIDQNADSAIVWVKSDDKEEAEYVFKIEFSDVVY